MNEQVIPSEAFIQAVNSLRRNNIRAPFIVLFPRNHGLTHARELMATIRKGVKLDCFVSNNWRATHGLPKRRRGRRR